MKLKDFLKEFEGVDPESEVYFNMSVGCCGDTEMLESPDVYDQDAIVSKKEVPYHYVCITFPALDFLTSCRRYAAAREAGTLK